MKTKYAIILFGGVGKKAGQYGPSKNSKSRNNRNNPDYIKSFFSVSDVKKDDCVNILKCKESIYRHIINYNSDYEFDIYVHSWSYAIRDWIEEVYKPVKSKYEVNEKSRHLIENSKCDMSIISKYLSIKRGLELVEECKGKEYYDYYIVTRPDVFINGGVYLKNYFKEGDDVVYTDTYKFPTRYPENFKLKDINRFPIKDSCENSSDTFFMFHNKCVDSFKSIFDYTRKNADESILPHSIFHNEYLLKFSKKLHFMNQYIFVSRMFYGRDRNHFKKNKHLIPEYFKYIDYKSFYD